MHHKLNVNSTEFSEHFVITIFPNYNNEYFEFWMSSTIRHDYCKKVHISHWMVMKKLIKLCVNNKRRLTVKMYNKNDSSFIRFGTFNIRCGWQCLFKVEKTFAIFQMKGLNKLFINFIVFCKFSFSSESIFFILSRQKCCDCWYEKPTLQTCRQKWKCFYG